MSALSPRAGLARGDFSTPAVVLKLDPNVMHHGGLGVIRSLGRLGAPVYALQESRWAPAANSRYLRGRYIWSPDPEDTGRLLAGLRRLAEQIGRPAVLIPTDDAGSIFLAEHGDDLRPEFLFPSPPAGLPRRLAGKFSMYELCRESGIPCPQAMMADSWPAAEQFAGRAGFPLIAKLATPWRSGHGELRSTSIVTDARQLREIYDACQAGGAELMLQEFIPGGAGHDWFFHGYCDADSVCRPAFTGVKERSYPAHAGLTCLGRSTANDQLRDQVTGMLTALGYRGILDLDLRLDARDGAYKLLDFNPRLGAQFRLFRDAAGADVVLAQYLDLTGQPLTGSDPVWGRGFLVENYDPIAACSYWRRGELTAGAWLASLRTVHETAWFARDDLAPFGLMCLRMGWRLATAKARRQPRSGRFEPRYQPGRAAGRQERGAGERPATPKEKERPADRVPAGRDTPL